MVMPSTNSMTMKSSPASWPTWWMVQIFGWFSTEAARASLRKRRRIPELSLIWGEMTLTATGRLSWVSSALYTQPIPPSPSLCRMWNGPRWSGSRAGRASTTWRVSSFGIDTCMVSPSTLRSSLSRRTMNSLKAVENSAGGAPGRM